MRELRQDEIEILKVISNFYPFPYKEIEKAYRLVWSFDKILVAAILCQKMNVSLMHAVISIE